MSWSTLGGSLRDESERKWELSGEWALRNGVQQNAPLRNGRMTELARDGANVRHANHQR